MNRVWYRKQSSRFPDINASPARPAFFSNEFEYMDLFGCDMWRPVVFVAFLDKNLPVFDVWKDSVEELCGYPAAAESFLQGDALETVTHCLGRFLEMAGGGHSAKSIRAALKKLDDEYAPMDGVMEATDRELLDFAEWAAEIMERARAEHVHPYKVVLDDMIRAKPGIKGIIDGPGSLMSIDPDVQSSVAYTLSMREVNWLLQHKADDMQSDDPARVKAAVEACRGRGRGPRRLQEDAGKPPVSDLGRVLRLDACEKQKDMCWGYDGFVLAHKDVNPGFDQEKPFMVVIDQDGAWQMHFENFGTAPKDEKVLDDMYKALAASCEKGMELQARGGATPGGISGISRLQDYGFKKVPMPDDTNVYWGGEMDWEKLEKWLNSGRHDDAFLVKDGKKFVRPDEYDGEITPDNTKPRPFKMVKTGETKTISESDRQIYYWAHMLDEAMEDKRLILEDREDRQLGEESRREAERKAARQKKARVRMKANSAGGAARQKAEAICGMPDLVGMAPGRYDKFMVYAGRVIVVASIGKALVPFYCSTGLAGKSRASAQAGRWFAFWGLGEDGWFNKLEFEASPTSPTLSMHNQFGSEKLMAFAKTLDETVGDVAGVFQRFRDNVVDLRLARAMVNQSFPYEPARYDDYSAPALVNYLNNMLKTFYDMGDRKAAANLIKAGKSYGYGTYRNQQLRKEMFLRPFSFR